MIRRSCLTLYVSDTQVLADYDQTGSGGQGMGGGRGGGESLSVVLSHMMTVYRDLRTTGMNGQLHQDQYHKANAGALLSKNAPPQRCVHATYTSPGTT